MITIFLQHAHVPENLINLVNKKHPNNFAAPTMNLQPPEDLGHLYQNCYNMLKNTIRNKLIYKFGPFKMYLTSSRLYKLYI